MRSTPDHLVRIAAEFFREAGFEARSEGAFISRDQQGAEWTSLALVIGEERGARPRSWLGRLADASPIPLPLSPRPVLPPTLVVVTARRVAREVAELVVFPHASSSVDDSAHARSAAPRIAEAVGQITRAAEAEGAMLSHEPLTVISEDDCPASPHAAEVVLGWA